MAVTAYKTPGALASVSRGVANETPWSDPSNAAASDNAYATASTSDKDLYTHWLRCTSFGFTASDIPSGSTIDGIEVVIERKASHTTPKFARDDALYLRKTSGQVGDNKASVSSWPTSDAEATYGGASDTWSAGLGQTDIVSADFGVDLSAYLDWDMSTPDTLTASVDCVKVRVYYTVPSGQPTVLRHQSFPHAAVKFLRPRRQP
ncbi:MAG: hypothetical protein FJX75_08390 [Armatimonadetes bacterium]|nr:hypothetical protein [Armatimonadota bacterium]